MVVEVLDVGDGACTIVTCGWTECDRVSIVDCGEGGAAAHRPANVLRRQLGARLSDVDCLVVTHFDSDHWWGLRELAESWSRAGGTRNDAVTIYYPGLPADVAELPAGMLALISTMGGSSGVRALDLLRAWENVSDMDAVPLAAGDPLPMGCDNWEVMWPPRRLPSHLHRAVAHGLEDLAQLAERMRENGFPALARNLQEAYGQGMGFPPHGESQLLTHDFDNVSKEDFDNVSQEGSDSDAQPPTTDGALTGSADHDVVVDGDEVFPEVFIGEARALSERLRRLNNRLSLAFHNPQHRYQPHTLIAGDLEGTSLKALIASGQLANRYDLMLAPHHGTHTVPEGFPSARVCVAQAGERHFEQWNKHQRSHYDSSCYTTHGLGSALVIY